MLNFARYYDYTRLCYRLGFTPSEFPQDRRHWRGPVSPTVTEFCDDLAAACKAAKASGIWHVDALESYEYANNRPHLGDRASRIWLNFGGPTLNNCEHCGVLFIGNHSQDRSHVLCSTCADRYITTEDGEYMLESEAYQHRNGEYYSYEEQTALGRYHGHPERPFRIRAHKAQPEDALKDDPFKLGFEWEYNSRNREDDAANIVENCAYAIAEQDGSLSERRGIEVVTGYSNLSQVCRWVDELYSHMDIYDLYGAGLHVNISGLHNRDLAKLIVLINENADEVCEVAGRFDTEYAQVQDGKLADWLRRLRLRVSSSDKYVHVRVREGYAELRVFDSSDDPSIIKARVQFVWLCAHFCAQPGADLSFDRLIQWFNTNIWTHRHVPDLISMNVGFTRIGKHKASAKKALKCQTVTTMR